MKKITFNSQIDFIQPDRISKILTIDFKEPEPFPDKLGEFKKVKVTIEEI